MSNWDMCCFATSILLLLHYLSWPPYQMIYLLDVNMDDISLLLNSLPRFRSPLRFLLMIHQRMNLKLYANQTQTLPLTQNQAVMQDPLEKMVKQLLY
jgi:hypothetical protein